MSKKFELSLNAATAIATYAVILHTGAEARREFCIAFVGEVLETGATVDQVQAEAKIVADYDAMDDAERALFRKQVQYCRTIADDWKLLTPTQQKQFVGGGLPASSAVKAIKAKKSGTAAASAPASAPASEDVKVSQTADVTPIGAEVFSPAEMAVRFAAWLDDKSAADMSAAEINAVMDIMDAVDAFRKREAEAAAPVAKAA